LKFGPPTSSVYTQKNNYDCPARLAGQNNSDNLFRERKMKSKQIQKAEHLAAITRM
jgi:hypothetical protein